MYLNTLIHVFHSNIFHCSTFFNHIFLNDGSVSILLSSNSFLVFLCSHTVSSFSFYYFHHPIDFVIVFPPLFPLRTPMLTQSQCPQTWQASGTCSSSPLRTSALSLMSCIRSGLTTGGLWTHLRGRYEQCQSGVMAS